MKKKLVHAVISCVAATALLSGASALAQTGQPEPVADREGHQSADGANGWQYNTYYIFPLTRHMSDSALPRYGQYALFPLAAVVDIAQLPFGALAGLLGE